LKRASRLSPGAQGAQTPSLLLPGLVVGSFGRHCLVETPTSQRVICHPRGKKSQVVVGDRVLWQASEDEGTIEKIEERTNLFYRQDEIRTKSFAANLDRVLILIAAEPEFSESQLSRALIAAEAQQIQPIIALNKSDLGAPFERAWARMQPYRSMGYEVLALSLKARPAEDRALLMRALEGHVTLVLGPSGAGKSTLINMIAGLIPIDSGEILFDGKSLSETKIGYVFQNYREALFPWMRTIDNIAYPLKLEGKSKAEVAQRMEELIVSFDVNFDLKRYPYELSGGQQQTASIMRALAPKPEVLFLDEPFSALDFEMTLFIREKLQDVFMQTGTTMLLVSHDLEEAVYLADQILLLTKRPTSVAEILNYNDPRPRTIETLTQPSFIEAKKLSLEIFQREVRK